MGITLLLIVASLRAVEVEDDHHTIGASSRVGCLENPRKSQRLRIERPGVYENYRIEANGGSGNIVKITANDVTIRNCEIFGGTGNGIGVFGTNVLIENCRIHHLLAGTYKDQKDAHGITGRWGNVTIRNCEIYYVSGDAVQFDPDRQSRGRVSIEKCTFWTGELPTDWADFKKGERPGENAVDTKTITGGERCELLIRDCYFHGWKQPGQIRVMAALNIKENVLARIQNCLLRENEVAFRLRGPGKQGGALVQINDCAVYDGAVGVRMEDEIRDLKIQRLGFGKGVLRKYQIAGGVGPGYVSTEEYAAPDWKVLLRDGCLTGANSRRSPTGEDLKPEPRPKAPH